MTGRRPVPPLLPRAAAPALGTGRSEYVCGAARSLLRPQTARAPRAPGPIQACDGPSDYRAPRTTATCALSPRLASRSPPALSAPAPRIFLDRSVQIPAGPTCQLRRFGAPARGAVSVPEPPAWIALLPCPDLLGPCASLPPSPTSGSSPGCPQPRRRGSARPGSAPGARPAMARARPPPPPPPPGLLPLLPPLLLLPLLLPAGCRALEGERRRGAHPRGKVPWSPDRGRERAHCMDPLRAGRTSEEGPPSARAPGAGGGGGGDDPGAASETRAGPEAGGTRLARSPAARLG